MPFAKIPTASTHKDIPRLSDLYMVENKVAAHKKQAVDRAKGKGNGPTGPSCFASMADDNFFSPSADEPSRFSGMAEYMCDTAEDVDNVFEKIEDSFAFFVEVIRDSEDEVDKIKIDKKVFVNAVAFNLKIP
ncbi:hypothetical protein GYMLUDRAFT_240497 [Collybiopsis luxurians FD-317 M1]|nr:hypothetical protein GYMLUDRAFT_240497 [Collybiopsis luxurians FD-317 M1]